MRKVKPSVAMSNSKLKQSVIESESGTDGQKGQERRARIERGTRITRTGCAVPARTGRIAHPRMRMETPQSIGLLKTLLITI